MAVYPMDITLTAQAANAIYGRSVHCHACFSQPPSNYVSWWTITNSVTSRPRFRAWTSGTGREAGSAQVDAARNISANAPYISTNQIGAQAKGAFSWHTLIGPLTLITYETEASGGLSFESSRVVPTAEENRPVNVALPVCIYLGLPT